MADPLQDAIADAAHVVDVNIKSLASSLAHYRRVGFPRSSEGVLIKSWCETNPTAAFRIVGALARAAVEKMLKDGTS